MFNIAKKQKKYTPEFNQQIVDLHNTGNYSFPQLSIEYISFIQKHLHLYTIKQMCKALKFPRSTYYKALLTKPSKKKKEYYIFIKKVMKYYLDSKKRYGSVKLCKILNDNVIPCSVKRIQRHMKRLGIRSIVVRKYEYNV